MAVVNVKVASIRPQYHNLEEWTQDPNNVYIGRRGIVFIRGERYPKKSSIWANPYKVGKDGKRGEVLKKYREYIRGRLEASPSLQKELLSLKGKNLGCWCSPLPCHGDTLLKMIEEYSSSK